MKLRTRLMLATVRNEDANKYLKEQLESEQLSDGQVQYLIRNLNINEYVLQNIVPVANAMKRGISTETIEYAASLLKDAFDEKMILAEENGKGALYNKVPSDLNQLLSFHELDYIDCGAKFGVMFDGFWMEQSDKSKNNLKEAVETFYDCKYSGTFYVLDDEVDFWKYISKFISENRYINNQRCRDLQEYNKKAREFKQNNPDIDFDVPTLNDLKKAGYDISIISLLNFDNIKEIQEIIDRNVNRLMNEDGLDEIRMETENFPYYLSIQKFTNVRLENDYYSETGVKEVSFLDTSIAFVNKNDPENDYTLSGYKQDRCKWLSLLTVFADKSYGYCDSNYIYNEDYIKKLNERKLQEQQEAEERGLQEQQKAKERRLQEGQEQQALNEEYALGNFYIDQIMGDLADNAWYGKKPTEITLVSGNDRIEMRGYTYEIGYEDYSATSCLSLNDQILYGENSRCSEAYRIEVYQIGKYDDLLDVVNYLKNNIDVKNLKQEENKYYNLSIPKNDEDVILDKNNEEEDCDDLIESSGKSR